MNEIINYTTTNDDKAIIENRINRIANLEPAVAYRDVLKTLSNIFPMYGIDGDLAFYSLVAKEIMQTFKQISSQEIEIAFRLFASQQLDLDDDIKFYGKVNMHTIGKILSAYIIFRRKIIAQHDAMTEAEKANADLKQRAEQAKAEIYKSFPETIANFKGKTYDDIPLYFFDIATNLGMITYEDGEKEIIWNKAKVAALEEKPDDNNLIIIRSHKAKLEQGNTSRAIVIAKKMVMWRKLFNKELN